ncbi:hypothetical protein C8J57DRAFT_1243598 [Mycena rebaudengoi]|nr:hypothetical protein C8J57DRAFT_1243598 [Mycena rebaudengoi]
MDSEIMNWFGEEIKQAREIEAPVLHAKTGDCGEHVAPKILRAVDSHDWALFLYFPDQGFVAQLGIEIGGLRENNLIDMGMNLSLEAYEGERSLGLPPVAATATAVDLTRDTDGMVNGTCFKAVGPAKYPQLAFRGSIVEVGADIVSTFPITKTDMTQMT